MIASWKLDTSVKGGPVHDGDSFHVVATFTDVSLDTPGYDNWLFTVQVREMVRLAHCNAPELPSPAAVSARTAVIAWFDDLASRTQLGAINLIPLGRDKYKRLLADVVDENGHKLSDYVLGLPGVTPMELHDQLL